MIAADAVFLPTSFLLWLGRKHPGPHRLAARAVRLPRQASQPKGRAAVEREQPAQGARNERPSPVDRRQGLRRPGGGPSREERAGEDDEEPAPTLTG